MTDAVVPLAPSISFPVIAIGASAGGLEALELFFGHAPTDAGFTYVVVQHLSPDHKSLMVELLSKHTTMPVLRIEDSMPLAADHVYLIPPKRNLMVSQGLFRLVAQDHGHLPNLPIDQFMASLAEEAGPLAVGVVLSGTGSDGTRGIRAIKDAGGTVLVQDSASARFDGMPRSAIATGLADFVLSPEQMPQELVRFFKQANAEQLGGTRLIQARDGEDLDKVLEVIRVAVGIDFSLYKRATVVRRVERRMSVNQCADAAAYLAFLLANSREVSVLHKELLIGVTRFFRDPDAWEIITGKVIPDIFTKHKPGEQIRCWVAGCSTGEEAYSLAIVLAEASERINWQGELKIFATDVDRDAIERASAGDYPESIVADVSAERLGRYFTRVGDGFRVTKKIRDLVVFAPHNITRDPPFYRIDLITCRNLLIYLQPAVQKKVLSLFHFALNRDSYMWLGSSESLGDLDRVFQVLDTKWKVWTNRSDVRTYLSENITMRSSGETRMPLPVRIPAEERIAQQIQTRLVDHFVPPGLVVDEQGLVVHVTGDVRQWIDLSPGSLANPNISRLLTPNLALPVSTAVARVRKDRTEVFYRDIEVRDRDEAVKRVSLRVMPLMQNRQSGDLVLVTFITSDATSDSSTITTADHTGQTAERMHDMEVELQHTRESLQAAIEELETTNEELQATNEELLAANEELQSTNEELQSVNEELFTVNAEYQAKIAELTELNHDIDTYLSGTQVGAIYLDRTLTIRKFTPAVATQINVMDRDIGRPLSHISHNLEGFDLVAEAMDVLQTEKMVERELSGTNGNRYIAKLMAYRGAAGDLRGVVITFVDVTQIRKEVEELRLAHRALDECDSAAMVLNERGEVDWVNPRFAALSGYEQRQLAGCNPRILLDRSAPADLFDSIRNALGRTQTWSGMIRAVGRNGSALPLQSFAIPLRTLRQADSGTLILAVVAA